MQRLLILSTVLLLSLSAKAQWGDPKPIEPYSIKTKAHLGYSSNSMAIVNGNPAIVCYDNSHFNIIYYRANDINGTSWAAPILIDSFKSEGSVASLIVVNGNPAIAYQDRGGGMMYIRANDVNGTSWGTPVTVDSIGNAGGFISMQVVDGKPAIAYDDATYNRLNYIRANDVNGTSWGTREVVDGNTGTGWFAKLLVVNGKPAITYYDNINDDLMYVHASNNTGSAWGTPVRVLTTGNVGAYASIDIVSGKPAIAYYNATSSKAYYIRANDINGDTWGTPVLLSPFAAAGQYISLAVINNIPTVTYYDRGTRGLAYCYSTDAVGTSWAAPRYLDVSSIVGMYGVLLEVNGQPAVAYFDQENLSLKYIRANNSASGSWGKPLIFSFGPGTQFAPDVEDVNGYPAVVFREVESRQCRYVRAVDSVGDSWGSSVLIDSFDWTVSQNDGIDIHMVNGNPAAVYYGGNTTGLRYARALDSTGAVWDTAITVYSYTLGESDWASLNVVDGYPTIALFSKNTGHLIYIRALDSVGKTWGVPMTLDSNHIGGISSTLMVIGGSPAIAYTREVPRYELIYLRANDKVGSSWGSPIVLDSSTSRGFISHMSLVNGKPAIAYQYRKNADLLYVAATDSLGVNWDFPVPVDTIGIVGYAPRLTDLNGYPVISYLNGVYNMDNYSIRVVFASSKNGAIWKAPTTLYKFGSYALVGNNQASPMLVKDSVVYVAFTSSNMFINYTSNRVVTDTNVSVMPLVAAIPEFTLVPNPARTEVKVNFDKLEGVSRLTVTNITGQVIYNEVVPAQTKHVSVPIDSLPAGLYIVTLHYGTMRASRKLLKE